MEHLRDWFKRQLGDPQVMSLLVVLALSTVLIVNFGGYMGPVLASIVIAYLLEGSVVRLELWGLKRLLATALVWLAFVISTILIIFALVPLLSRQLTQALQELPTIITSAQQFMLELAQRYPELISAKQVEGVVDVAGSDIGSLRQTLVERSLVVGEGVMYLMIYLVLVPLMVFFLLKDKVSVLKWVTSFLPKNNPLLSHVWLEIDLQLSNYVRGKFIEIVIVWAVSYAVFALFGLNYALLLSVLVGVSVLVPYIGAIVATFPIAFVAYAQWGFTDPMAWTMGAYAVIQFLDGNILVPLLFSEVTNLHPVAIISAVLFFGGIWGFWGVFFAIPLATVVNAVINAWRRGGQSFAASQPITREASAD